MRLFEYPYWRDIVGNFVQALFKLRIFTMPVRDSEKKLSDERSMSTPLKIDI